MPDKKVPQFFVDDDSGEPRALFGDAENIAQAANLLSLHYVETLLRELVQSRKDGDSMSLTIYRKDMTEAEVEKLPDV